MRISDWSSDVCSSDLILKGDHSMGEFYSVAVTNNHQQADTGTKMIHLGKNTRSRIVSKGISAVVSNNSYLGLVKVGKNAHKSRSEDLRVVKVFVITCISLFFLFL